MRDEYGWAAPLDFLRRIWSLNHALERASSRMQRELGITAQQRLIVRCIGKYPGLTPGQLAGLLHVDPGTVSATLRRLEANGILERRRDGRDQRRVTLGLTARGRALDRPTLRTVESAVERLLEKSDAREVESTKRVLDSLTAVLDSDATRSTQRPRDD